MYLKVIFGIEWTFYVLLRSSEPLNFSLHLYFTICLSYIPSLHKHEDLKYFWKRLDLICEEFLEVSQTQWPCVVAGREIYLFQPATHNVFSPVIQLCLIKKLENQ